MTVPHHGLIDEFPRHEDNIRKLIADNPQFAYLDERYEALTAQIESLENDGMPISDEELEKLKLERLKLKDDLYALLRK